MTGHPPQLPTVVHSKAALGRLLGVAERTISELIGKGLPVQDRGSSGRPGTYDVAAAGEWYRRTVVNKGRRGEYEDPDLGPVESALRTSLKAAVLRWTQIVSFCESDGVLPCRLEWLFEAFEERFGFEVGGMWSVRLVDGPTVWCGITRELATAIVGLIRDGQLLLAVVSPASYIEVRPRLRTCVDPFVDGADTWLPVGVQTPKGAAFAPDVEAVDAPSAELFDPAADGKQHEALRLINCRPEIGVRSATDWAAWVARLGAEVDRMRGELAPAKTQAKGTKRGKAGRASKGRKPAA
jgi:hypothetical protein